MEQNLVKGLESSMQDCISTLLSQGRIEDDIPNKTGVECCIEKFLQSARQLEAYFSKYQMYSTVNHPQDAVREDITKLREELDRKEALLNSLQAKTIHWNNELDNLISKQNNMFISDHERRT
ncbi:mediator of RNA polymerase II transcription subunit 28-like [Dendronephthya gigantea]|uniref:mediator of RNA polymerase II transcription subunit 28-like n=1 Tax=Dendronephthya gigantea TaxID=151771 RepID=UPI0010697CF3|nr:mediator of RNA polymerase II transcription subunit 28-like [Dendronephthya gigantea]